MSLGAMTDPASPAPMAAIPPMRLRRLRPKSVRGLFDVCPTVVPFARKILLTNQQVHLVLFLTEFELPLLLCTSQNCTPCKNKVGIDETSFFRLHSQPVHSCRVFERPGPSNLVLRSRRGTRAISTPKGRRISLASSRCRRPSVRRQGSISPGPHRTPHLSKPWLKNVRRRTRCSFAIPSRTVRSIR